jgi:hypothetical protein
MGASTGIRRHAPRAALALAATVALVSAGCAGQEGGRDTQGMVDVASGGVGGEAPTPTTRPPRTFSVITTGDFLIHMPVQRKAKAYGGSTYDFAPMLAEIAPVITSADLAFCHMETPLSPDDTALSGYPIFNAPHEIADAAAAAGWDSCSTASNHSLDRGAVGVAGTLDVLDGVGLGHVGTARSAAEAATPDLHDAGGVAVAHLDYTYGTNGIPVPAGQPWLVNLIDVPRILADARAAKAAGAEVVIVEMHWGNEYQSLPTDEQRAQAAALLDSADVDLVIGQHVHVVQAAEKRGTEYVIYGTGNLLSNQGAPETPTPTNDGVIVKVTFTEQPDGRWAQSVAYTPTWVDRSTYVIHLATPTANPQSYQRTVAAMNGLGPGTFDGAPTS